MVFVAILMFLLLPVSSIYGSSESHEINDSIVKGTWQVEYLVLDPDELLIPVSVKTLSFTQTVRRIHRGYIITVTSSIQPLHIGPSFSFLPEKLDEMFKDPLLETNLENAKTPSDALRACLEWLERAVKYSNGEAASQDVAAVIQRGSGNCVGRSEILSQLLRSIGIDNRTVTGCLYKNGQAVFHRWIEVDYPDLGSLPTEPGTTQDFVTPYHLVLLPSDRVDPVSTDLSDLNVVISITNESQSFWTIDLWPAPDGSRSGISRRQTTFDRCATVIIGQIVPVEMLPCDLELTTAKGIVSLRIESGGFFSFLPVEPGHYKLAIRRHQRIVFTTEGYIESAEMAQLYCRLKQSFDFSGETQP